MHREGEYRKSTYSGSGGCLEVAPISGGVNLRDSKNLDQDPFFFTRAEWEAFLQGVRDGQFDFDSR
jgi:hypothetical protein